jgi:hypothetical protein
MPRDRPPADPGHRCVRGWPPWQPSWALVSAAGAGWVVETQRHDAVRLRAFRGSDEIGHPSARRGQEALLSEIGMALASPQTPELRVLHALTADAAETPIGR